MRKILQRILAIALFTCMSFTLIAAGPSDPQPKSSGFSIVSLQPDAAQAIKATGKKYEYPFPNSANKGKKFNPAGTTVLPLETDSIQKVLVLFVDFTTTPPGAATTRLDLSYFDNMLFGTTYDPSEYAAYPDHPTDRTLVNYFAEVSYGAVDIVTLNMPSTMGWQSSGHPYNYYCKADGIHDNGFGSYPQNVQGLVIDAINAFDPIVDFSQYAVNGQIPNLFVVFAGTGAEWSGAPDIIWSHSWDLSEGTGLDGYTVDGVKINNYAMMPEVGGDLTAYTGVASGPFPPTVGVFAHEYSHVLGLPDQYDYGYESEGTGNFSLMAGGSWNRYPNARIFSGNSPSQLDAWSKYRLGFVNPIEITTSSAITLAPVEVSPVVYKMVVPGSDGKEYYLFENRQQIGFDQGLSRFNAHGLAIYHIDETIMTRNPDTYWRPNEAENWKENRSEGWRKAENGENHYAISLIQADDLWDLEHATNRGDGGDLYPGVLNCTEFSSYTFPNSTSYYFWMGNEPKYGYSGVTVKNIQENAITQTISATFSNIPWRAAKK